MLVAVLTTASPVEESAVVASVLIRQRGSLKSTVDQKIKSDPRSAIAAHRRRSQLQFVIRCVGNYSIFLANSKSDDESGEVKAQACH